MTNIQKRDNRIVFQSIRLYSGNLVVAQVAVVMMMNASINIQLDIGCKDVHHNIFERKCAVDNRGDANVGANGIQASEVAARPLAASSCIDMR